MDNHDDTTTTEYDSGGSEGVDYVYEDQAVSTTTTRGDSTRNNQKRIETSPKRRTSPRGKRRDSTTQCVCGAAARKESDSESTASEYGTDDSDDDVDGTEKRLCRPTKAGHRHETRPCCHCCDDKEHKIGKNKPAAKKSGRRSPYIEEYPDEPRPMILLKEHKLPRRFSNSDEKRIRGSEERQLSSSLGKVQTMGKRPPWVSTHQSMRPPMAEDAGRLEQKQQQQQQSTKHRRRRQIQQEIPGGRFSGSDMDDSDSEVETGDRGPARQRQPSRYDQTGGVEMATSVTRSSAWNHSSSPKYSSSWPLQRGSHYPARGAPQPEHAGYESGDESDDIFDGEFEFDEVTHRRRPRRPPSPPPRHASPARQPHHRQQVQHQHQHQHHDQHHHHQQQQHQQPRPAPPPPRDEPRDEPVARPRRVRPPRPPVAKTVISRPSMAAMDQGYSRASATTDLCDIWRGRPEDWESPYSSSSDAEYDDGDCDDHEPMMLLEGTPPQSSSSPQLLPPRRSTDMRFPVRSRSPSREPSPVPYHPRRIRTWDAADERYLLAPPAPSTRGGGGGYGARSSTRRRAPSQAPTERSRWTVMAPVEPEYSSFGDDDDDGHYGYFEDNYIHNPGLQDYSYGFNLLPPINVMEAAPTPPFRHRGATSPPPPFGSRKRAWRPAAAVPLTADEELQYGGGCERAGELLSPVPTRMAAARFNFDKSYSELSRMLL